MSAVALKTALIKPSELRDACPWNENFESETTDHSWKIYYKKQNISLYNGIEFYVCGSEKLFGQSNLLTSITENINKIDNLVGFF
jgi:hypothetical protein